MAYEEALVSISQDAAVDLSDQAANRYRAVKYDAQGNIIKFAAVGDLPAGILQNEPTVGQPARLGVGGVSKVRAGGAIGAGVEFTFAADGRAVAAAVGSYVIGTTMEAAVAGDIISAHISVPGAAKKTA